MQAYQDSVHWHGVWCLAHQPATGWAGMGHAGPEMTLRGVHESCSS